MLKKGFTLTELIVVVAIIAVLLSFLIPALAASKERAKTIICSSNQKQLMTAMLLYENNNSTFPYAFKPDISNTPPGGIIYYSQFSQRGWWWQNYIERYIEQLNNNKRVLECPLRKINDFRLKSILLCSNYGVNQSICKLESGPISKAEFTGTPLSQTSIREPSKTVLLLDSGYNMINYWHAVNPPVSLSSSIEDRCYVPGAKVNEPRLKQGDIWPGQEIDAIEGRHWGRRINAVFVDGHLEKRKADSFIIEKTQTNYTNVSSLWVPR